MALRLTLQVRTPPYKDITCVSLGQTDNFAYQKPPTPTRKLTALKSADSVISAGTRVLEPRRRLRSYRSSVTRL